MTQAGVATTREQVSAWLCKWLKFHNKWRVLTMLAYTTTTIVSIVASTLGGIVAVLGEPWSNRTAAALSGLTAIVLAIEKTLLFREKWRLHLTIYLELQAISLKFNTAQLDDEMTVDQATALLRGYGRDLPIGPREEGRRDRQDQQDQRPPGPAGN